MMSTRDGKTATASDEVEAASGVPLSITHKELDSARARGEAEPLASGVIWIARYQSAWWIAYEGRWLHVTDESLQADLDRAKRHLDKVESVEERQRILRRSLQLIAAPSELAAPGEDV